jgi:predicted DNA-binding transcriptional regulator AlpA
VLKLVPRLRRFEINEAMFLNDKEVARLLGLSPSWVRGQRYKRSHGMPHILDLEPRYIGRCPRYVRGEVDALIAALAA